jgi:hypothetical protein
VTNGLAILAGYAELAVLLAILLWFVLRRDGRAHRSD